MTPQRYAWSIRLLGTTFMCLATGASPTFLRAAEITIDGEPPKEEAFTLDGDPPAADAETAENDAGPWQKLTENLRFALDVISRVETTRRRGEPAGFHALGFDLHKVFSDERGDIGTLILQPYLRRIDNALPVPHDAEDDDDWEMVFHNVSFNLTRWGKGRTNFKIGHFDIPYGLELNTDTHLTVHQLISHENIGADMDWGVSFNGTTARVEYEVALTQGSGHEYINTGKNYVVAGRIGTPFDRNFVIGASAMHGQIIDPHRLGRWASGVRGPSRVDRALGRVPGTGRGDDDLVRRTRAGLDVTWIRGPFTLSGEASGGRDFNQDVFNALAEAAWTSPSQKMTLYVQAIYLGQRGSPGWDEDVIGRLGAVWKFADRWSLSGEYDQELKTYGTRQEDAKFTLQLRLYF